MTRKTWRSSLESIEEVYEIEKELSPSVNHSARSCKTSPLAIVVVVAFLGTAFLVGISVWIVTSSS